MQSVRFKTEGFVAAKGYFSLSDRVCLIPDARMAGVNDQRKHIAFGRQFFFSYLQIRYLKQF